MSHLDYSNSLLYGVLSDLLDRLQKVQNAAARVVLNIRKYDHITQGLRALHWLPVRSRIIFKLAVITFKVLRTEQPQYLRDLLIEHDQTRTLRSNSASDRSFAVAAPKIWNSIPDSIKNVLSEREFRRGLKTHLFKLAHKL